MSFFRVLLFVLVSVVTYSHGSYVGNFKKCTIADKGCHKDLIQSIITDISEKGIPEIGIPPVDPMEMKDISASIANVIDLVLVEGTAKGVKSCVIESADIDFEKLHASIQLTCDITIKGKYNVKATSPIIEGLIGQDVTGSGNGKLKIEKITLNIQFPFKVIKRGDKYYLESHLKNYKYTYNIQNKVSFAADNLYIGEKESSKEIVKLLNENWKTITDSFGKHILDVAMKIIYKFLSKILYNIPTEEFITDDISALA